MTTPRAKAIAKMASEARIKNELCEANKLLLNRMESHPEEFHLNKGGKWADYLNMLYARINGEKNVLVMISQEECSYMWEQYCKVAKDNLHKTFMGRLFADKPEAP